MRTVCFRFLVAVFVCLCGYATRAQNNGAGVISTEINYLWTDSSQYLIRFKVVYDCNTSGAFSFSYLDVDNHRDTDTSKKDTSFQLPFSAFILVSTKDLTPVPASCPQQSKCNGGLPYGWQELVFEAPLFLDSFKNCLWTVSYTACCRPAYVSTIHANQPHYNYCEINQCLKNSSHSFKHPYPYSLLLGRNLQFSPLPVELAADADSISIHLAPSLQSRNSSVAYVTPYSASRPINFFGFPNANLQWPAGFRIDPHTGDLLFRPVELKQAAVVAVEIVEWRKTDSVMRPIGKTRRDFIMGVDTLTKPADPIIHVTPSSYYQELCPSDTLRMLFPVKGVAGTPTEVHLEGAVPAMQITTNGSDSLSLFWIPSVADKGLFRFRIEAVDSACPMQSKVSRTLLVRIRDSVHMAGPYAGSDQNLVYGPQVNLHGVFNQASRYPLLWQADGDGYFSSDSLLNTVYHLGPLDSVSACQLRFVLSVSGVPGCFIMPHHDTSRVFFHAPKPEIQKTGQSPAADTLEFSVLNTRNLPFTLTHNGQGTYSLNPALASFQYFPTAAEKTGSAVRFEAELTRCGTEEDTLSAWIHNPLSVHDVASAPSTYPNPFDSYLVIEWGNEAVEGEVVLYSACGQAIQREPIAHGDGTLVLETSSLPPGLYWVKFPGRAAQKVVKAF